MSEPEFSFKSLFVPFTTVKAIIFLIIIGIAVYSNSLLNGFVGDDNGQILGNPAIHSILNFFSFFRGSTFHLESIGGNIGIFYRPILTTTFSLIYTFFGANAFFFHSFQLILHITNTILIFFIFKKFFNKGASFLLSLLFLIHPINNEAVVYISNLQEQLFSFFGLLALNILSTTRNVRTYIIIGFLLLLSLLSKETGIIFVPVILLYYLLFIRNKSDTETKNLLYVLGVSVLFYFLLRIFIGNNTLHTGYLYMSKNATLLQRLFTVPSIIFYYIKNIFVPTQLAFGWYWVIKIPNFQNFGLPLIIDLTFILLLSVPLFNFKKNVEIRKIYLFFYSIFFLNLILILQIVPLDLTVADRWFYMSIFGLLGMVGVIYKAYLNRTKMFKYLLIAFSLILVFIFSAISFYRNSDWYSNLILCRNDLKINPKSYILEYCYANEMYNSKEYSLSKEHALKAITLYPEYFLSWDTLGQSEYSLGDRKGAIVAFKKTLSLNDFGYGSDNLALMYVYDKNPYKAKEITQKYLAKIPNSPKLWYSQALADYLLGNSEEATQSAKNAYTLEPSDVTYKLYYRLDSNLQITIK